MLNPNDQIEKASAKGSEQQLSNFIRNLYPDVVHIDKTVLGLYPSVVHVVPDTFVTVHKLKFDYEKKINEIRGIIPPPTGVKKSSKSLEGTVGYDTTITPYLTFHDVYQLNDVKELNTSASSGKTQGSCTFTIQNNLINTKRIYSEVATVDSNNKVGFIESPEPWSVFNGNPDAVIDKMDIVKIFERNRFNDRYSVTFTGFVTNIKKSEISKGETNYTYTCCDVTAVLRMAEIVTSPSIFALIKNNFLPDYLKQSFIWDAILSGMRGLDIIKFVLDNAWTIFPPTNELVNEERIPSNLDLTKIEVQNPRDLEIVKLITFPKNIPDLKVYGQVFKNVASVPLYTWRGRYPIDIINDVANVTGFEFYATPEGNLYYGIPKWDMDVDGAYYRRNKDDNSIERVGYYNSGGEFFPVTSIQPGMLANFDLATTENMQKYTILPEEILNWDEVDDMQRYYTRVELAPTTFNMDMNSTWIPIGNEQFFFTYPNFDFSDLNELVGKMGTDEFKDLTRYGLRSYKCDAKPFLSSNESLKAYVEFVYNYLKMARRTATLTIPGRPEMVQGRTIRIPNKNLIAYVDSISHGFIPKKRFVTVLSLKGLREADSSYQPKNKNKKVPARYERNSGRYPYSTYEKAFGAFVPVGTFDFTQLGA